MASKKRPAQRAVQQFFVISVGELKDNSGESERLDDAIADAEASATNDNPYAVVQVVGYAGVPHSEIKFRKSKVP
jgi:hypothetical protein